MPLSQKIKEYVKKTSGHLNLSNTGLYDDDISELADLLKNRPDIISIDLQSNMGRKAGLIALLSLPHIKRLNFSFNDIVDEAFIAFIKLLEEGKTNLEFLDISRSALTDKSLRKLLTAKTDGKTDRIEFVLEPNSGISVELIDQFYGRKISPEMKQFGEQLKEKTVDISPQLAKFIRFHQHPEQTVAKDTTNLQQVTVDFCSTIREKMVDSSRNEQIKFLQTLLTQLSGIKELRTIVNFDEIKLPSISPPPSTTPPIKAQ